MKRVLRHNWRDCQGSICMGDPTDNWKKNVVWYPGEPVCLRTPYSQTQRVQLRLNKLFKKGLLKFPKRYFTAEILEKKYAVRPGTKGKSPEEST